MNRFLVPTLVAALLVLLCGATPVLAQTSVTQDAPDKVIYPIFGWLPLYGADLSLPSGPPCTGCPSDPASGSASSSGLSGAWFASGRLEFGRFELTGNYNYAGLSAQRDRPIFKADVKLYTAAILAGVRVYGPLFVEGGTRYYGLHATFDVLTFPPIDWDPGQWVPAVGTTFRPRLGPHWLLYSHLDFGGLGVGIFETVNGEARIEWRPIKHLAVTGGWSFSKVTYDDTIVNRPIHFSQTVNGPLAGIGIPF